MASHTSFVRSATASVARCVVVLALLHVAAPALWAQAVTLVPGATRVAGVGSPGFNNDFGTATNVELNGPTYSIFDTSGNQYISDTGDNCVRKVDAFGDITTLVGLSQANQGDTCDASLNPTPTAAQGLLRPLGLALDAAGNLYIADSGHNCVRKLPSGEVGAARLTAVIDTCLSPAAASVVPNPSGLALDASNNIYVATSDALLSSYQVVEATSTRTACRVAGALSTTVPTACPGITNNVVLNSPSGLVFDPLGNLFIADTSNSCVRELTSSTGAYSTPVGQCVNDSTGSKTLPVDTPFALAFDQQGRLYISSSGSSLVYQSTLGANLVIVAGVFNGAAVPYNKAQDGTAAVTVPLSSPKGLSVDGHGNIYVSDTGNNILRQLNYGSHFPATPVGATGQSLTLFFQINSAVNLTTNVGQDYNLLHACSGPYTPAGSVNSPPTVCFATVQFTPTRPGIRGAPLYLADSVSGKKSSFGLEGNGTGAAVLFAPGVINTLAFHLVNPVAITVDTVGNAYYLDAGSGPGQGSLNEIQFATNAKLVLFPPGAGLDVPTALALDAAGNFYIADSALNQIQRYDVNGNLSVFASGLVSPTALAIDSFGNVYVAEGGSAHAIVEIQPGGEQRIIAGQGNALIPDSVPATSARLVQPTALAFDSKGVLYVADKGAYRVYSIDTAHNIHLLAGNGTQANTVPGTALGTALLGVSGLAVDAASDVFIADSPANRVLTVYASPLQNGSIAPVAGNGTSGFTGDGGSPLLADLNSPTSFTVDGSGNMFLVDAGNSAIREISYQPPTIDFGNVIAGQTSPPMTTTLWDIGTDNLQQIVPQSFSDPAHFSIDAADTTCGQALLSGAVCTFDYVFTPTGPGPFTSTVTFTDNSYFNQQTLTLVGNSAAAPIATLAAPPVTAVYGQPVTLQATVTGTGPAPTGTITFSYGGVNRCPPQSVGPGGNVSCVLAIPPYPPVGVYVGQTVYSGDQNYATVSVSDTLTVVPAALTVTANNQSRAYGVANPPLTVTVAGLVANDTVSTSASTTATIASPPGTYPIIPAVAATGTTSLANYAIALVNGTLTIGKAAASLVITANNATRVYGTPNPAFTGTVAGSVNGDVILVTYATTATPASPVGTYPITATLTGASAVDYNATIVSGTLTITQAPTATTLAASAPSAAVGAAITFTATVTSPVGLVPTGSVIFSDGPTMLATVPLSATGTAAFSTATLGSGTHSIVASYPPTTNFAGSNSSTLAEVVAGPIGSFSLAATPNQQLVKGGAQAVYNVTVTSVGGFIGPVALSCAGLPADASCAFTASTGTLAANGTFQTTMTTTSTAADARLGWPTPGGQGDLSPVIAAAAFPLEFTSFAALIGFRRRKRNQKGAEIKTPGGKYKSLWLLAACVALLGLAGCGCPSTAFHSYPITITATSVNAGPAPATTTVYLSVSK